MIYEAVQVRREVFGRGENLLACGSITELPEAIALKAGQVQCVYADPPFMTGERFLRRRPYGTAGWKKGTPSPKYPAFDDRFPDEETYLLFLNELAETARELLQDTGVFYLHLDWRSVMLGRQVCDRVFGKTRFLNEIIWSYESGGRSKRTFSRKHDTVLLYAKGRNYRFDLTRVPMPRLTEKGPRNHMARGMAEDGRMYSRIVSGGKEYRYYDDEPVYPGDVWTDISHLQQRDPERTGYATQKPLKLLDRLLRPVTAEGDLVADLCCGSGTALEAAQRLNCRFIGMDLNPEAVAITLGRLKTDNLTVDCPCGTGEAALLAEEEEHRFRLGGLEMTHASFPACATPLDNVEAWDTGSIRDGVFYADRSFRRSFRYPELVDSLQAEPGEIQAVLTTDAAGIRRAWQRARE